MQLAIGVMGSATEPIDDAHLEPARRLGGTVARAGCALVTGACPGLPHAAAQGARAAGGLVVGISPALCRYEHEVDYGSPVDGYDLLVYTGSGLMGREVVAIRSSDIVVIVAGHSGTLGEFAIAYDEGRLIGVLTGTGGVADLVDDLVEELDDKSTGSVVLYDDDPERLVSRLLTEYRTRHHLRPNCFTPLRRVDQATPPGAASTPVAIVSPGR